MSNELKPCPFCVSEKVEPYLNSTTGLHDVVCRSCGTRLWVESWQRRPIEDALRAEVARLNEKVKWLEGALNLLSDPAKLHIHCAVCNERDAEHEALKAKLARYEADLTDEQAQAVWDALPTDYFGEDEKTLARQCDAAIRKVRGES